GQSQRYLNPGGDVARRDAFLLRMSLNDSGLDSTSPDTRPAKSGWFATTHWSVVLAAREADSAQAAHALETLERLGQCVQLRRVSPPGSPSPERDRGMQSHW